MTDLTVRPIPALCVGKFSVYPTGLMLLGEPEWEEWEAFFNAFGKLGDTYRWVMGDALRKVEIQYGEGAEQLTAKFPDYEYERLRNYRWVSEQVEFVLRNPNLSWSHHRVVAKLPPKEQKEWLDYAIEHELGSRELGREISGNKLYKNIIVCPNCGYEWEN